MKKDGSPQPASPIDHFGFDKASVGGWFDAMSLRNASVIIDETDEKYDDIRFALDVYRENMVV